MSTRQLNYYGGCVLAALMTLGACNRGDLPLQTQVGPTVLTIFVATDGADDKPGTKAAPLATLHRARNRIRAIKAETGLPEGGITVYLRGGEYILNSLEFDQLLGRVGTVTHKSATTFKLEWEDSGTEISPIFYRAYRDEAVTLMRGPDIDFRVSLIINQANHVFFEGINTVGSHFEWLKRKPVHRIEKAEGDGLRIVIDGQARAIVVVADKPSDVAQYAAEELIEHVRKATGVMLLMFRESEVPTDAAVAHRIYIGITGAAAAQGLRSDKLGPEAFILKTVTDDLYVLGREAAGDPLAHNNLWVGTARGVYELLERCLSVRWLWPGELGTYVPQSSNVVIAPVNEVVEPAFRYKAWSGDTKSKEIATYLRRHGMNSAGRPYIAHQGLWEIYGKEHPEWFALNRQGERVGPTLCVSNPELRKHVSDRRSHPEHTPVKYGAWARGSKWDDYWNGGDVLSLGEADKTNFCHCPACEALDAPHPQGLDLSHIWMDRVLADRYADFWKAVYERAKHVNPDVKITTLFYWQTFHAPLGVVDLSENFFGTFVPWMRKSMWFPMPADALRDIEEQWLGWKKTGISLAYRPNYFWGGYVLPFLSTRQAGEFLKFTLQHGSVGWKGDSLFGDWAIKGPMLYMHMRLLNKPEMTIDDIRAEYFSAFGPAAPQVERYFDYWEEFSHQVVNKYSWPKWGLPQLIDAPHIYNTEAFAPAAMFLDTAIAAARQHPRAEYTERVEFLRLGLEHARLAMTFLALLNDGEVVLHDRKRFETTQQAWRAMQAFRKRHEQLPFADLKHAASLEKRYLKRIETLEQDFDEVKKAPPKETPNPWSEWRFRTDPDNCGLDKGWQTVTFDAEAWKPIKVPAHWSRTWAGGYLGYGWYRTTFRVPAEWVGQQVNLNFGGVDEQAWVYINGKLVGEHTVKFTGLGPAKLWKKPFTIEVVPAHLRYGAENTLVVRVHASVSNGGIHKPVVGHAPHPEDWRPLPAR